jgi:glutathione reductase (NADPH)
MSDQFDLIVIGGGSGGLAAARRAAEYGARVALIEAGRLGGACVNVGCVPKKIMWNAADLGAGLHDAPEYGFQVSGDGHNWPLMKQKRDAYVLRLNGIYETLLASKKVELVRGYGRFEDSHTVVCAERRLTAKHIIVATGSRPLVPAIKGAELGITSDGFFELADRP